MAARERGGEREKEKEKKHRRGRGEGAVFERKDGRWVAELNLGYGPDGRRRRVTVYATTKREVLVKLHKLQRDALQGLPVKPEKITVREHLEDWLRSKKGQVCSGTHLRYEWHLKTHVIPALGGLRMRDVDYRAVNLLYANWRTRALPRAPSTISPPPFALPSKTR